MLTLQKMREGFTDPTAAKRHDKGKGKVVPVLLFN
jgi:hypothetical protein